jgi:phospholipid/cholesterol/gamma-HCH transport system ATP-binding protein
VIRLDGVVKRFGARTVLDGVSFTVPDGRTLALLGRSGTGKSVILKHIVGLLRPEAGWSPWTGRTWARSEPDGLAALRREIGYVFQFAALSTR